MGGLLLGSITNIILDALFVMVLGWGMKGAAMATIIGQFLNAVYYIVCMFRFKNFKLCKKDFKLRAHETSKVCSLGAASFVTQIANVVVIAVMNNALVKYGTASVYGPDIPLAAIGITMKVNMLIISVVMGIATGGQPILGYNYGAGKYKRTKQTYKVEVIASTCIMTVAFIIFQTMPEHIVNIFGSESELYMEFAVKCFRIFLLMCFTIGVSCVTSIFFQAIGKPVQSVFLSLARQVFLLIPLVLILGKIFGIDGILWAGAVADGLACALAIIVVCAYWKKIFGGKQNG